MMKLIRNEQGLTLVEILAALIISAIVLGTAIMAFAGVSHLFEANSQRYNDQNAMKRTMNTIASHLADSTQVIYFADRKEFRLNYGVGYKAIIFDEAHRRLTLYDFSAEDDAGTNDYSHFIDGEITLAARPALYTDAILLAETVQDVDYIQSDGNDATTTDLQVADVPLSSGELIEVRIIFAVQQVSINGERTESLKTVSRSIKLLSEPVLE